MYTTKLTLVILFIFFLEALDAQNTCFVVNQNISLEMIFNSTNCSGATTYNITSSPGNLINCTNCNSSSINVGSIPGTIEAEADGGCTLQIEIFDLEIEANNISGNNCASYNFNATTDMIGNLSYTWHFPGNITLTGNPVSHEFQQTGLNQPYSLTVSNGNCSVTLNEMISVGGPQAELEFSGIGGFPDPLNIVQIDSLDCVVSYCVSNPNIHNQLTLSNVQNTNQTGTNTQFVLVLNGNVIYDSSSAPSNFIIEMDILPATLGYNSLNYQIIDDNGCSSFKEYQIYWEDNSNLPGSGLSITSAPSSNTSLYCVGDVIEFEYSADQLNPLGVTYLFYIACGDPDFTSPNWVYADTLQLAPGNSEIISWPISLPSCICQSNQLEAHAYIISPCYDMPVSQASETFEVAPVLNADFNGPLNVCQNTQEIYNWNGSDNILFSSLPHCQISGTWAIEEPSGTFTQINSTGPDISLNWTFDEIGEHNVCLIMNNVSCSNPNDSICKTICSLPPVTNADIAISWNLSDQCAPGIFNPSVTDISAQCDSLEMMWSISPACNGCINNPNSYNPTINIPDKGEYAIQLSADNACSSPVVNSDSVIISQPPLISFSTNNISPCPDSGLEINTLFCIDTCFSNLSNIEISIFQGLVGCSGSNIPIWNYSNNVLPPNNLGLNCSGLADQILWPVPANASGDYTLKILVQNSCGTTCDTLSFHIDPINTIINPFTSPVCSGFILDPGTTSYISCNWQSSLGNYTPGSNVTYTILQNSSFEITCGNTNCSITDTIHIDVFPQNVPSINSSGLLCSGQSISLTCVSSPGSSLQWNSGFCANAVAIPGQTNSTISVSSVGDYSVSVTDINGCTTCAETTILQDISPMDNLINQTFCQSNTSNFIDFSGLQSPAGTWGGSLIWTILHNGSPVSTTWTFPDTYTVGELQTDAGVNSGTFTFEWQWTSPAGCLYSGSFDVIIQSLTPFSINLPSDTCAGTVISTNDPILNLASCDWIVNGLLLNPGSSFTIDSLMQITVNCGTGVCQNSASTSIGVFDSINPYLTSNNEFICNGGMIELHVNATNGISYEWFENSCGLNTNPISINPSQDSIVVLNAGQYHVLVEDIHGCVECASIDIQQDVTPFFLCNDSVFCESEVNQNLWFNCLSTPLGGWGQNDPIVNIFDTLGNVIQSIQDLPQNINYSIQDLIDDFGSFNQTTNFEIEYTWTSESNCDYSGSYFVTIETIGTISSDVGAFCQGESILFNSSGNGIWDFSSVISSGVPTDQFTILPNGDLVWVLSQSTPVGNYNGIEFTGACLTLIYNDIEVLNTPNTSMNIAPVMCIHDQSQINFNLDGSVLSELFFINDQGTFNLPLSGNIFDPSLLGISSTSPGTLFAISAIDHDVNGQTISCFDTISTIIEFHDIPDFNGFEDICEGSYLDSAFTFDLLVNSFELEIIGLGTFTSIPLLQNISGTTDYELTLYYGNTCSVVYQGSFFIQEQLEYSFNTIIDPCIPQVEINIDLLSGNIDNLTFDPSGIFSDNVLNQMVIIDLVDPSNDQDFSFNIEIGDNGCSQAEEHMDFTYIAPIEALLQTQEFGCSNEAIFFDLTQVGSNTIDSIILFPEDGNSAITYINDYDNIQHSYFSPVDTTSYFPFIILFNQCSTDTVTSEILIDPPMASAMLDENIEVCPGDTLYLNFELIGTPLGINILIPSNLQLDFIDQSNNTFIYFVPFNTVGSNYSIEAEIEMSCGTPFELSTNLVVHPSPEPIVESDLNCFNLPSFFSIENNQNTENYSWTFDGDTIINGAFVSLVFENGGTHNYTLTTTNSFGCISEITDTFIIPGLDGMNLVDISNCGSLNLNLNAGTDFSDEVQWTISSTFLENDAIFSIDDFYYTFNSSEDPEMVIDYFVNLEVINQECVFNDSFLVRIFPLPNPSILIDVEGNGIFIDETSILLPLCKNDSLLARSSEIYSDCAWETSGNAFSVNPSVSCSSSNIVSINENNGSGYLIFSAINQHNCTALDSVYLDVACGENNIVFIPNAITPNGDGKNDTFSVVFPFPDFITDFQLEIFDRWGNSVFYVEDDVFAEWNGKGKFNPDYYVESEIFIYRTKFVWRGDIEETIEMFGHVTVVR